MDHPLDESLLAGSQPPETAQARPWRLVWALILAALAGVSLMLGVVPWQASARPAFLAEAELRYLYVSFHGDGSYKTPLPEYGVNQVLRFDLEDLSLQPMPVLDWSGSPTPPRMLRDMKLLSDGSLFIAQGLKFDSCILQYGPCTASGERLFVKEYRSPILVHPYALTFIGDTLYASTQDSGTVMAFDLTDSNELAEGGRIRFNLEGFFRYRPGITYRGIASFQRCLYVSVTEMDVVAVICNNLTHVSSRIQVRHPIGLMVDEEAEHLYIASPGKHKHKHEKHGEGQEGEVMVWDLRKKKFIRSLKHEGMKHPTNMVLRHGSVIVASQTQKSILEFKRSTGSFQRVLFRGLPDSPENIMLSPC
mmetsp:Transcript_35017/g.65216  ORF Transcript_35017/g.65216 Transcript_35017/m.65216 type:complete len:363 (-) Transcript_35017:72-1160(-)